MVDPNAATGWGSIGTSPKRASSSTPRAAPSATGTRGTRPDRRRELIADPTRLATLKDGPVGIRGAEPSDAWAGSSPAGGQHEQGDRLAEDAGGAEHVAGEAAEAAMGDRGDEPTRGQAGADREHAHRSADEVATSGDGQGRGEQRAEQ